MLAVVLKHGPGTTETHANATFSHIPPLLYIWCVAQRKAQNGGNMTFMTKRNVNKLLPRQIYVRDVLIKRVLWKSDEQAGEIDGQGR